MASVSQQVEVIPEGDPVDFPHGACEGHPVAAALRLQSLYLPLLTLHAGVTSALRSRRARYLPSAVRAAVPNPDYSTSLKLPWPKHGLRLNSQQTCLQQTISQRAMQPSRTKWRIRRVDRRLYTHTHHYLESKHRLM